MLRISHDPDMACFIAGCSFMLAHDALPPYGRLSERIGVCGDWEGLRNRRSSDNTPRR